MLLMIVIIVIKTHNKNNHHQKGKNRYVFNAFQSLKVLSKHTYIYSTHDIMQHALQPIVFKEHASVHGTYTVSKKP